MKSREELLQDLSDSVLSMDSAAAEAAAKAFAASPYDPAEGISKGLLEGMRQASRKHKDEEYFLPELFLCSDAMYRGLAVLQPLIPVSELEKRTPVVVGVVEGDPHDIGKNLLSIMLSSSGFDVTDLGAGVPSQAFIDAAVEKQAPLICLSTMMSTTMNKMEEVIRLLKEQGLRDQIKVMIGGGPVSETFAEQIGADAYTESVGEAVIAARRLLRLPDQTAD